jgi:glycosyltransferase involved in cell wall biosynthesis
MISVVIPTHNRERLLIEALESVRAQDVRPIEIVVVDDGSTDGTVAAVNRWRLEHPDAELALTLLAQENRGGNAARNAGVRAATGDIVAFLDSDDTWRPDKLRKQRDRLAADTALGAVYCGLVEVDAGGADVGEAPTRDYPEGRLFPEILVRDMTAPTSCFMLNKTVFDVVGYFDESLEARQDWDMWIRVAQAFPIGAVPERLVQFRRHEGERTTSDPAREIRAYRSMRKKYRELLVAQSVSLRSRAASAYHRRLGRVYFHRGLSRPRALGHYLAAWACAPLVFDNYAALGGFFLPAVVRQRLHRAWNRMLGRTPLAIRSH